MDEQVTNESPVSETKEPVDAESQEQTTSLPQEQPPAELVPKSRVDVINELLVQKPIEQNLEWYKINYPDVYAGYMHVKGPAGSDVKAKAKTSLKTFAILIAVLGVFAVIVIFVLINFLTQAGIIS